MSEITVEQVRQAGVVGAGGAGFPTYVKLSAKADTVLINAAECEPLLHKDKEVLKAYAAQVVEGLLTGMRLVGAKAGVIGIKEKYTDVIEALGPHLGKGITVATLPDAYPAGDEFILVYEVLGRVIPPGGLPLHVGAMVMNVETAVNVAASPARPVTQKFISVAGAVVNPLTLRVPVGLTLAQCVVAAGGPTAANPAYLVGGVMMGNLQDDHDAPVDKTTGAVVVLDESHPLVVKRRRTWEQIARIGRSACDQCSFCTELCPRYLLGHPIEPHRAMRSLAFNLVGERDVLGASFCCECNLCSLYSCPEDLDPKNTCAENKRRMIAQKRQWDKPPFNPRRPELHMANRRAPMHRLIQKLGLQGFTNVGPLSGALVQTGQVAIRLKQHVGAPCEPMVQAGQAVKVGDVVGTPPMVDGKPALGAPVHASIDGVVSAVKDGIVYIERR